MELASSVAGWIHQVAGQIRSISLPILLLALATAHLRDAPERVGVAQHPAPCVPALPRFLPGGPGRVRRRSGAQLIPAGTGRDGGHARHLPGSDPGLDRSRPGGRGRRPERVLRGHRRGALRRPDRHAAGRARSPVRLAACARGAGRGRRDGARARGLGRPSPVSQGPRRGQGGGGDSRQSHVPTRHRCWPSSWPPTPCGRR